MTTLETLLSALCADPGDAAGWLALADCLEEEGRLPEAELTRLRETLRDPDLPTRNQRSRMTRLQALLEAGVRPVMPRFHLPVSKSVRLEMVLIPPGEFWLGSPRGERGRTPDEGPRQRVVIRCGFWMGIHPVTQAQWHAVMRNNPSDFAARNHPVETIDWNACQRFCSKLGRKTGRSIRLPSEVEWEYACRATTTTSYHSGTGPAALERAGWYTKSCAQTMPVGQKEPNAWGLYDMHGNVWEWCADRWLGYDEAASLEQYGLYMDDVDEAVAQRGGSWWNDPSDCRSATRNLDERDTAFHTIGVRVVMDL